MTESSEQASLAKAWLRPALVGGGVSSILFLSAGLGVGTIGNREALALLEATVPTLRFLSSSAIGASATVLALILTMVGLSLRMESEVRAAYFDRIRHIGTLCVVVMVAAVGLLLALTVPISETEGLATWYTAIYYVVLIIASLLGGGLVAITMALRKALIALVAAADPEAESSMIVRRDEV